MIASVVGFLTAALGNYTLHEIWTFRRKSSQLSRTRAIYYLITIVFTLFSRLVGVSVLSVLISSDNTFVILIGATMVSFIVNFAMSKYVVFSKYAHEKG